MIEWIKPNGEVRTLPDRESRHEPILRFVRRSAQRRFSSVPDSHRGLHHDRQFFQATFQRLEL
jgi:hypothetical protein